MVEGMAVGVWESEGTYKGERSVEAVSGRQTEGRSERERSGNNNRTMDWGGMDADENGMERWGKEGDTDARRWQGWKGRYLEAHGERREERRENEEIHIEEASDRDNRHSMYGRGRGRDKHGRHGGYTSWGGSRNAVGTITPTR